LAFSDADQEAVDNSLKALKAPELSKETIKNLSAVLSKVVTLEGMISVADMRLFRSKEHGRNRVTSGSW
jgi:hypothetical protein